MKRTIFTLLLMLLATSIFAQVEQDCPQIDCPGRCGRFIDGNSDGFCDRGQLSNPTGNTTTESTAPAKEEKETPAYKATTRQTQPKEVEAIPTTTPQDESETDGVTGATSLVPEAAEADEASPSLDETDSQADKTSSQKPYHLILISSLTLGLYALTFILVKANVMKLATHRKIWNVLLLVFALVSCLLGFLLVIQINYNVKMDWLWTVKLLHVEFGIAMTIIALFHIFWHVNYWKTLFKNKKKVENNQ
ncbi:MAG: hypothetical protein J5730_05465 [Bacteroidales bacterium]|nr:hypothetical protein [Bacteroidales bacterium]